MADLDITVDGNLTNNTAPATTDRLLLVDDGTTSLQDITLANLLKVVNSLTADGTPDTSADYLLAYDADAGAAKKVLMSLVGGGTATSLTNKSSNSVALGDVVIFETGYDEAFNTTVYAKDLRVCGVATETIAIDATGNVATGAGSVTTVNCDTAAVARGQFLITSTTAGKATGGSYYREPGVFAVAVTSKAAGATGTVKAMLVDNYRQAIIGTSGWNMGGWSGSAAVVTSQKFTIATETWATVAGAALPAARYDSSGMGNGTTCAYTTHGASAVATASNSRYKITYSTELSSTLTAGAVSRHTYRSGVNFATKGWMTGGNNAGTFSSTYKTTYATDAEAAGNNLSSSRESQGGISDGTYCYVGGDTSVNTDRLDNATEVYVLTASAALGNALSRYNFLSFPASAGYRVYNNGSGTSYSRKLTYSTATDANNGSSASGNIVGGAQVTDGVALAYASGTAAANKLASSTGVYSSITNYPAVIYGAAASYAAL